MKKLMFVMTMLAAMAASAEMKFGTVDLMLLVRNHPNYESNRTLLRSTDKDYQKRVNAIKADGDALQEEGKKLADQMRNPMLTAKAKTDIENQLMEIQKKLIGVEQRYKSEAIRCQKDLQDLESRLLKTTTDDLRKRIVKYAGDNGYDFIFDANAAPFAKESFSVTDDLLKAMGVDPANAKGRDESK